MPVFISYAREDLEMAKRIYNDLKLASIHSWMDEFDLSPGEHWENTINTRIEQSNVFLAIMSPKSLGKRGYVQSELRQAIERNRPFIGVRIKKCKLPRKLQNINHIDLFPDYNFGMSRLIEALKPLI